MVYFVISCSQDKVANTIAAISRSAFAMAAAVAFFREVYRSWLKLKMHLSILAEGLMWSIKKVKK